MIEVTQGSLPILLGFPHAGTELPDGAAESLNETGRALAETDWHIDRLYNGLGMDVSVVRTAVHRYVVDVDHPPPAAGPFPWLSATGVFPLSDRSGAPIYRDGAAPDDGVKAARVATYHTPYHQVISAELRRLRAEHGVAVLLDCHSVGAIHPQEKIMGFPDINIWSNLSKGCSPSVERCIWTRCRAAQDHETALAEGTLGGWSVLEHGQPEENIHAVRLELAQRCYMDERPPWHWRADKAERMRSILYRVLNDLVELLADRAPER